MVYTDPIIYFATRLATALIGTGGFFAEPTFCVAGGGGGGTSISGIYRERLLLV